MKRFIYYLICTGLVSAVMTLAHAEDRHWVPNHYGTDVAPLSCFVDDNWVLSNNTTPAVVPVDGESIAHTDSCCNPKPFITIDNGGSGVNLPNSDIRFDAKTNIFDSSAGDLSDPESGSYDLGSRRCLDCKQDRV